MIPADPPFNDDDALCDLGLTYRLAMQLTSPAARKQLLKLELLGARAQRDVRVMARAGALLGVVTYLGEPVTDLVIPLPAIVLESR